ncbi:translation initiation factor IF-2-like [Schistocerca cancellata]|uniref:translation initiation factor IF-2-like n=1 Tax=Schistocerca cancellata TaxID=274614 RepID=UPI002117DBB7|nr:translation initiation factor IF-2-like [Schistocerca cancellata]
MGKRTHLTHAALILGLAVLVPQCVCKPQGWSLPKLPQLQTPVIAPGQLPFDCAELTADPRIPKFLIQELCSQPPAETAADAAAEANDQAETVETKVQEEAAESKDQAEAAETKDQEEAAETKDQEEAAETKNQEEAAGTKNQEEAVETNDQDGAVEAKDQEVAENAAKEVEAAEEPAARRSSSDGAKQPVEVIVPFFRVVIQKLISPDAKVPTREFWAKAYQEAGSPKLARHPTFFEIAAGVQQAVESFRSEDSWPKVVRLIKDLTSDKQWKRLEAVLAAAHGRDPANLWKALGAAKALKVALKSSIKEPQCRVEGPNPDPEDCREFFVCFRLQGRWKSKDAKCPKYTEFSPSQLRCVWAPFSDCVEQSDSDSGSDEDSDSGESSREVIERILKHGPGAFHVQ